MHIFFSGIGGAGIGPLALIAYQAGFDVSGSDKQSSEYIDYLKKHGVKNIYIGQNEESIKNIHRKEPIDWYVYSSAVSIENPNSPELEFCKTNQIKTSKRDELLNMIINERKLRLIAVAGTHGKSTTTAMLIWLFKELKVPLSYSLGAKISFGQMGEFNKESEFFVYEADEFDNNFLSFTPYLSLISGVSWDHHEIFPTKEIYNNAFKKFIRNSDKTIIWSTDHDYLGLSESSKIIVEDEKNIHLDQIKLHGHYNRLDAYIAARSVHEILNIPMDKLINILNHFPGVVRRMEEIVPGLYTDYAHTPEKIKGAMSTILEIAKERRSDVVVLYEPLTDRRQHYIKNQYRDCFEGAKKIYWLPSYLAREDPASEIIQPEALISNLTNADIAKPAKRDQELKDNVAKHLNDGDLVVGMNGGGGNSLDEWLKKEFGEN